MRPWDQARLTVLREYRREFFGCLPTPNTVYRGVELGTWLVSARRRARYGTIDRDLAAALASIDPRCVQSSADSSSDETYDSETSDDDDETFNDDDETSNDDDDETFNDDDETSNDDDIEMLDDDETSDDDDSEMLDDTDEAWNARFAALNEFVSRNHRLPKCREAFGDCRIGDWIRTQRRAQSGKNRCKMTPSRVAALESIDGWTWDRSSETVWRDNLELLHDFVSERGRMPSSEETYLGVRLGLWVRNQRNRKLSPDRIAALESINGWVWNANDWELIWQTAFEALGAFVEAHGRLPKRWEVRGDVKLGRWVDNQRRAKKGQGTGRITPDRIAALETIPGWSWGKTKDDPADAAWWTNFELLRSYVAKNHKTPPVRAVYRGVQLGAWAHSQRQVKKGQGKGRITPERIAALETISGWQWGDDQDAAWWTSFELLRAFVAENHEMPSTTAVYHDVQLGKWVSNQRSARKSQGGGSYRKITPDRIVALETIPGWLWGKSRAARKSRKSRGALQIAWRGNFELLRACMAETHTIPTQGIVYRGVKLGYWVDNQRKAKKRQGTGRMTPERIAALETIPGWSWGESRDDYEIAWWTNFELLRSYVAENHGMPSATAVYRGVKLGAWFQTQRMAKKGKGRRKITPERVTALETIPDWSWAERDDPGAAWWTNFELLRSYVAENREMPSKSAVYRGVKLGIWISTQRQAKKGQSHRRMMPDRATALETVEGWHW
jgi:ribosomal protein S18